MKYKPGQQVSIKPYSGNLSIAQKDSGKFNTGVVDHHHGCVWVKFQDGSVIPFAPDKVEAV